MAISALPSRVIFFAVHGKVLFLPQFYFGFAEFHEIDDPSPMLLFEANEKCSEKGKEKSLFWTKAPYLLGSG